MKRCATDHGQRGRDSANQFRFGEEARFGISRMRQPAEGTPSVSQQSLWFKQVYQLTESSPISCEFRERAKRCLATISCVAVLSRAHSHLSAIVGSIFVARRAGR